MHTGRFWDPTSKQHSSGELQGVASAGRAYSAVPLDLDGDGDLDLLVGTDSGKLVVRINEGTPKAHAFSPKAQRLAGPGGAEGFPDGYAMPVAVDWDGDGRFDLVSGGKRGGVYWMQNTGTAKAPSFAEAETIVHPDEAKRAGIAQRSQVDVADFDGDGDLDLLVGDNLSKSSGDEHVWHGRVWLFRRTGAPDDRPAGASGEASIRR